MKKNIDIIVANPAGNITIFVKDEFDRPMYQTVANQLLDMKEFAAEQVAFIKKPYDGVDGKMEMCGLEFCGNASRSFGLITAMFQGKEGKCKTLIDVSGCDENLTVDLDMATNYTKIKMPMALSDRVMTKEELAEIGDEKLKDLLDGAHLVDFGGIVHVVMKDKAATEENYLLLKNYINGTINPPAMGTMFFDTLKEELTPVVYVTDVDSTYWEGSCGSGSTATAIAFASEKEDGNHSFSLKQPAGTIISTVEKVGGKIEKVYIEGPVDVSDIITVSVEI